MYRERNDKREVLQTQSQNRMASNSEIWNQQYIEWSGIRWWYSNDEDEHYAYDNNEDDHKDDDVVSSSLVFNRSTKVHYQRVMV